MFDFLRRSSIYVWKVEIVIYFAIRWCLCAFLITLYFAFYEGKLQQVIRTERRWGPGDKEVWQQILEEMTHGQIPRVGAYAYENNGMAYEAYHM